MHEPARKVLDDAIAWDNVWPLEPTSGRHLDHVVNLVGIDHVGLGLDIVSDEDALHAYVQSRPDEWPGAAGPAWPGFRYVRIGQLEELVDMLVCRNYTPPDIRKILGENYMRPYSAIWGDLAGARA